MVTPEDREKKLAAILGKMKNGADELCAPPPPLTRCGRIADPLARAVPLCAGLCAGACGSQHGTARAARCRTLLLRAALLPLPARFRGAAEALAHGRRGRLCKDRAVPGRSAGGRP
jgi:hypothetical protein